MKTQGLAAVLAVMATSLYAGQRAMVQKATAMVCMQNDRLVLMGVRPLVSASFASIGIGIDWRELEACPVGADAIEVRLARNSVGLRDSRAEALAFARPYTRTVVVFLDRVKELNRLQGISVMPSVLVHEITHILEGIDRHSATGIMKAHWNYKDYLAMRSKPLAFAAEDVDLIYVGVKAARVTEAPVAVP